MRLRGVAIRPSMLPRSSSRTTVRAVSRAPTIVMMMTIRPGTMKLRDSRSSLNQKRVWESTGISLRPAPLVLSRCARSFWLYAAVTAWR